MNERMERLTYKNYIEEYEVNFEKSSDKNWSIAESDTHIKVTGEPIEKLGELEDVMEKYGIKNAEELDGVLKPLIDNGELENWRRVIFWKTQNERLKQELAELKRKAIVPKFSLGQEVWAISVYRKDCVDNFTIQEICFCTRYGLYYKTDMGINLYEYYFDIFATREEAEQKLALVELKGEEQ